MDLSFNPRPFSFDIPHEMAQKSSKDHKSKEPSAYCNPDDSDESVSHSSSSSMQENSNDSASSSSQADHHEYKRVSSNSSASEGSSEEDHHEYKRLSSNRSSASEGSSEEDYDHNGYMGGPAQSLAEADDHEYMGERHNREEDYAEIATSSSSDALPKGIEKTIDLRSSRNEAPVPVYDKGSEDSGLSDKLDGPIARKAIYNKQTKIADKHDMESINEEIDRKIKAFTEKKPEVPQITSDAKAQTEKNDMKLSYIQYERSELNRLNKAFQADNKKYDDAYDERQEIIDQKKSELSELTKRKKHQLDSIKHRNAELTENKATNPAETSESDELILKLEDKINQLSAEIESLSKKHKEIYAATENEVNIRRKELKTREEELNSFISGNEHKKDILTAYGGGQFKQVYNVNIHENKDVVVAKAKDSSDLDKLNSRTLFAEYNAARLMLEDADSKNFMPKIYAAEANRTVMKSLNAGEIKNATLTDKEKLGVMIDICKSLSYFHKNIGLHNDIAMRNIVLHKEKSAISHFCLSALNEAIEKKLAIQKDVYFENKMIFPAGTIIDKELVNEIQAKKIDICVRNSIKGYLIDYGSATFNAESLPEIFPLPQDVCAPEALNVTRKSDAFSFGQLIADVFLRPNLETDLTGTKDNTEYMEMIKIRLMHRKNEYSKITPDSTNDPSIKTALSEAEFKQLEQIDGELAHLVASLMAYSPSERCSIDDALIILDRINKRFHRNPNL